MAEMGFNQKALDKLRFRDLLVYLFALIFIGAIAIFSVITYMQAIRVLRDNFVKNSTVIFQQVKNDLTTKLNNIENTLRFISTDLRIQKITHSEYEISNRDLAQFFMDCISLNSFEEGKAGSRFKKNLIDELIFYNADRTIISRRDHFSVYGIEKYLSPDLLTEAKAANGQVIWSRIFLNKLGSRLLSNADEKVRREELNQLAVIKYVADEKFKAEIGYLVISINLARLSSLVEDIQIGDTGRVFIIDNQLRILAGFDKDLIYRNIPLDNHSALILKQAGNGSLNGIFNGENCFIHYEDIGVNDWKLVGIINNREFQNQARVIRNRILINGLFITLVLIGVILMISNRVTRPLQNISEFLQQVEAGDLSLRIHEGGSIEIENLSMRINKMIERINQLLKEIYREQIFKRKAALKALHAQINPHFLYNTLDSISWMIETGKRETAVGLVESLSSFFRVGLSGGRDVVTLREEVEHAESYLKIQQVRYQDRLDYIFDIDEEILTVKIVKITLQPLIENAIYHGVKLKKEGQGKIYISGQKVDRQVKITVVDNGAGMDEAKLTDLNESLKEAKLDLETVGKGYSVQNINSRIKLYFGKEYGLCFFSKEEVGTRVEVTLPLDWNPNRIDEEMG